MWMEGSTPNDFGYDCGTLPGTVPASDSRRRALRSNPDSHPDAALLRQVRDALDRWQAAGLGPTSSITGAGAIRALEEEFSARLDGRPALAMPAGTSALRVALQVVGVEAGDEVVCPAYDWPAAVGVVRSLGAVPVFADVDAGSLTIDPGDVARRLGARTRAVVATHLLGIPADMRTLRDAVGPRLAIVEDCAQALGATLDGAPVGTFGTAAAFSFGPGKAVDAGEGGMVVLASSALWREAVRRSQHPTRQLVAGIADVWDPNLTCRIHPVAAIVALAGLASLDERLARWRQAVLHARDVLARLPCQVELPGQDARRGPSWKRLPLLVEPHRDWRPEWPELELPGGCCLWTSTADASTAAKLAPQVRLMPATGPDSGSGAMVDVAGPAGGVGEP
jgi:dTDP-4-amino-4,6-dideoxygalactose transaminase